VARTVGIKPSFRADFVSINRDMVCYRLKRDPRSTALAATTAEHPPFV
jgi:hypothetical protein